MDKTKAQLEGKTKAVALRLGARIREARRAMQITLQALSRDTELSPGFLSRLERGESSASISNLIVIAGRLGIPLRDFFEDSVVAPVPSYVVNRALDRAYEPPLTARGYTYHLTSGRLPHQQMSAFELVYPVGEAMTQEVLTHAGEEVLYLLEGEFEFRIGTDSLVLKSGDCVHFSCEQPHAGKNIGAVPARLLMVLTPVNSHPPRA
jgi:transcriptional regulator with XRE-family HTH domain